MNRRGFLFWVGVGWLPVLCRWRSPCSSQTTQSESAPQKSGFAACWHDHKLDQTGELLNKITVGPVLVVHWFSQQFGCG